MDPYQILNIDKNATNNEIKRAFRRLSMKLHPDKNANDASQFKLISNAYTQLTNTTDTLSLYQPKSEKVDIEPIFITKQISLLQAYLGTSLPIKINKFINTGNTNINRMETIYLNIPRGIDTGEIIYIKNRGNIVNNEVGDIHVNIEVVNTTDFERDGLDIIFLKTLTLKEALCGFDLEIRYLNDKIIKINNNNHIIYPEYKQIIYEMGMVRGEYTGNLIIHFKITFPKKLTDIQKKQLIDLL